MKISLLHDRKLPTGVLGLAITPNASLALAACIDGAVYKVNLASGDAVPLEGRHRSYSSGCVLLPDGQTAISSGYDGMLLWHDLESGRCWRRLKAQEFWIWQMALSPDGSRVATVSGQYLSGGWRYEPAEASRSCVKVFEASSGELIAEHQHGPPVLSCAFSQDGRHLAAANMMGEVRIWNTASPSGAEPVAQWRSSDFTSWGTIKSHHHIGGVYGLAFAPDGSHLLGCGMGPMADPMAGNGKMTWQSWNFLTGEKVDQIKQGHQGAGLMESIQWHPDGIHFVMSGRQAQGTWNSAVFSSKDGNLVTSLDTKKRITHARFSETGQILVLSGATGQGQRKEGNWPHWGRVQSYSVEL